MSTPVAAGSPESRVFASNAEFLVPGLPASTLRPPDSSLSPSYVNGLFATLPPHLGRSASSNSARGRSSVKLGPSTVPASSVIGSVAATHLSNAQNPAEFGKALDIFTTETLPELEGFIAEVLQGIEKAFAPGISPRGTEEHYNALISLLEQLLISTRQSGVGAIPLLNSPSDSVNGEAVPSLQVLTKKVETAAAVAFAQRRAMTESGRVVSEVLGGLISGGKGKG